MRLFNYFSQNPGILINVILLLIIVEIVADILIMATVEISLAIQINRLILMSVPFVAIALVLAIAYDQKCVQRARHRKESYARIEGK